MSSKRNQVWLAVAGSVALHLAVLFVWACTVQWFPAARAASQTPEQLRLEVVAATPEPTPPPPNPAGVPTPPPRPNLAFHDTADLPEASVAPQDPVAESDRNSQAASEFPATGDKPLPTQTGRPVPRFAFDTHPFAPGDDSLPANPNTTANMPPPPSAPATTPPPPRPAPPAQAAPEPTPVPTPASTPAADPRDLALVTPKSIPAAPTEAEPNPYDPSFRPPAGMTEPPRPTPVPRRGGYRTEQTRTASSGGIGTVGASSLATEASPRGRYFAAIKGIVDRRYRQFFVTRADVISYGVVWVHFTVARDGRVRSANVVSNTSNEAGASIALSALLDAQLPPMPPEVAAAFDGGILDSAFTFTIE